MERYNSFAQACVSKYGRHLYRVALDAGMTCPNRDGTIGKRGCIFCDEGGSGDFAIKYDGQKVGKEDFIYNHQDAQSGDYIAYFQAYTNTYDSIDRLRMLFSSALENEVFAGISIATRPDCISEEVLTLLITLQKAYPKKFIWIELGLQTIHERSAIWMRRGYPLEVFDDCVQKLKENHFEVIVHVILGLPFENEEMVLQTIEHLNTLKIDGIKLQLLHYLSDTDLGKDYLKDTSQYPVLTKEEYEEMVAHCIGHLDSSIVIHRLTGDGNGENLLAPKWSTNKKDVLNQIRHILKIENIIQGCLKGE